jgi:hypothetical protein
MSAFAKVTYEVDHLRLLPVAKTLYNFFLQQKPAGLEIEFHLDDFVDYSAGTRSSTEAGYSLYQIKRGLQDLIEKGVLTVIRQWWGGWYRVVISRPEGEPDSSSLSFENRSQMITNRSQKIDFEASNPDSFVPITENIKINRRTPSQPPVSQELTEGSGGQSFCAGVGTVELEACDHAARVEHCGDEVKQGLVERAISELGLRMTRPIYRLMVESTVGIVLNAIEAAKERFESKTAPPVRSKEAMFTVALKRCFTPNRIKVKGNGSQAAPEGFSEWFREAQALNWVKGSVLVNGEIYVVEPDDRQTHWMEFQRMHPLPGSREPIDLAETIAEIDVLLGRLRWSDEDKKAMLLQWYGVSTRSCLTDAQLLDFRDRLKSSSSLADEGARLSSDESVLRLNTQVAAEWKQDLKGHPILS